MALTPGAPPVEERRGIPARRLGATFLVFLAPAVIAPVVPVHVVDELGGGDLGVGLAVGAASLAGIVGRPLAGILSDARGPEVAFAVGAGLMAAAVGPLGLAPALGAFLVLRLLQGAADSLAFVGAAAGQDDGSTGRGVAYTRFATVLTGGTTIGPLVSAVVVDRAGEAAVWPLAAACALAALALGPRSRPDRPSTAVPPARAAGLVHRGSLLAGVGMGLGNIGFVALAGWAVLLAGERGLGVPGLVLSCFALLLTAGRLVGAGWPDRFGPRATIGASIVLSVAGLLGMAVAPGPIALVAAAGVLGAGSALLMPALLAEAVDRAGAARRGQVVGTIVGGYDACSVVAAVALGVLADRFGEAAVFAASAAATALAAPTFARWRRQPLDPARPAAPVPVPIQEVP